MGINDGDPSSKDSKDQEVPEEEKKVQELNEVQMAINDYTNDYNKNKHVVLKSKNIDADKLADIAIKKLEELHKMDCADVKDKGKHFG